MKLYKFQWDTYKNWITVIPTIEVHIDSAVYIEKNISIILNIFTWHFRWLFIKESKEEKK